MKLAIDQLIQRLTSELGSDVVSAETERLACHEIDGQRANLLCSPEDPEQLATALRICTEAQAAIVPWGGGTAMAVGNRPRQINVVLRTGGLSRIIDHDPANLTVTTQGGLPLASLQTFLARERQFVPFDPPCPEQSSIGGILAVNFNGPRRSYYGSVRDLVIGMKINLMDGSQIKAGGKVVKNVAGYDMCKLFVGSLGTLGIIMETTLRLTPLPETAVTMLASGSFAHTQQFAHELDRSKLLPAAVALAIDAAQCQIAVRFEGFSETVARCRREATNLAAQIGLGSEILSSERHNEFWRSVENFPLQKNRLVFRITVPRAEVFSLVESLRHSHDRLLADVTVGTLWLASAATKAAMQQFSELTGMARNRRGHAVIFSAPSELKHGFELWGESPATLSLMRELKQSFDPSELLNPGRFVAGI